MRKRDKPPQAERFSDPSHDHPEQQKRYVSGDIRIRGTVEAHLPPTLVEEYQASNRQTDAREKARDDRETWRFRVESVTLAFVAFLALLGLIQSCESIKSAGAAKEAADAATLANDITAESIRARIDVDSVRPSQPVAIDSLTNVTVVLKDMGQLAAFRVRSGITQLRSNTLPEGDMSVTFSDSGTVRNGSDGLSVFTLSPDIATETFLSGLPRALDLNPRGFTVYTFGRVEYVSLKKTYTTEFCYFLTQSGRETSIR